LKVNAAAKKSPNQNTDGRDVAMRQLGMFDEMNKIGLRLQEAREGQSKSLEDIHEETRITTEHLKLLEQGNFTFLPETYVKSFLKTYAQRVGLDSIEIMQEYGAIAASKSEVFAAQDEDAGNLDSTAERSAKPQPRSSRKDAIVSKSPSRNQIIEWALILGTILLAASLVGAYILYRSKIQNQASSAASGALSVLAEIEMCRGPIGADREPFYLEKLLTGNKFVAENRTI